MSKKTASMNALETLGLIHVGEEKRDAIHLAVEPVKAGEDLNPADHISVADGIATLADVGKGHGIVDPFLTDIVKEGERFWLVLYPRTIQSLRHVWTHPGLPDEVAAPAKVVTKFTTKSKEEKKMALEKAIELISGHAKALGMSYDRFLAHATDWVESGQWYVGGAHAEGYSIDPRTFWPAWSLITGRKVPEDKRENFVTCTC